MKLSATPRRFSPLRRSPVRRRQGRPAMQDTSVAMPACIAASVPSTCAALTWPICAMRSALSGSRRAMPSVTPACALVHSRSRVAPGSDGGDGTRPCRRIGLHCRDAVAAAPMPDRRPCARARPDAGPRRGAGLSSSGIPQRLPVHGKNKLDRRRAAPILAKARARRCRPRFNRASSGRSTPVPPAVRTARPAPAPAASSVLLAGRDQQIDAPVVHVIRLASQRSAMASTPKAR